MIAAQFKRLDITTERVYDELAAIGFVNMRHFARWGPHGVTLLDSTEVPEHALVCVAEVSQTVTQHGGTTRIRLHDKLGALQTIARLKRINEEGDGPEERARAIRAAMAELDAATMMEPS